MIKWIITNWMRNKAKFVLLLIGALLISAGLSFLIGLSETSKGTIINTLEKKWKASYDIVVRPYGTESITESDDLLDPNYLSGLSGGISFAALDTIKEIKDVDIAAPISILGYTMIDTKMGEAKFADKGVYRLKRLYIENDGIRDYLIENTSYYAIGMNTNSDSFETANRYGLFITEQSKTDLSGMFTLLVAAIDPVAEAQLVGLDHATVKHGENRYFQANELIQTSTHEAIGAQITELPLLLSTTPPINYTFSYELEKLNVATDSEKDIHILLKDIEANGIYQYLDSLSATKVESIDFDSQEAYQSLLDQLLSSTESILLNEKASPLNYKVITSPFPDRWQFAYEIVPPNTTTTYFFPTYRNVNRYDEDMQKLPRIKPQYIGYFDPTQLNISIDPTTDLPMETYRSPTATYVLDKNRLPINPPTSVLATSNPFGYIMQSPTMLTTIEAAKEFLGDAPISAIRIKVTGVESLGEESQQKLEAIAAEIEEKTGLRADITLGSSPQPLLIHIPQVEKADELGWIEQPWIKTGASINIFHETKLGYSGIIGCLLVVATVYIFSTNLITYLSRKKEFAILKALGWKNSTIRRMMMTESLLIGSFVSSITLAFLLFLKWQNPESISGGRITLIINFILLIYIVGALWPSYFVSKVSPMQAINDGEISKTGSRIGRTRGMLSMVRNNLLGRWLRNLISVMAISLPSSLLILFVFVSTRLNGVLYTSWLGEYVAMEVGTPHYVSVGLSLIIAILTAAEIIWQNVLERTKEIALFKAIGWKNYHIQMMVIIEGAFIGLVSGIIGILIGMGLLYKMYGTLSPSLFAEFSVILLITVIVGMASAIIPSLKATKVEPVEGLNA